MKLQKEDSATSQQRKADHIDLAFRSRIETAQADPRFYYEPMLGTHPDPDTVVPAHFAGYDLNYPIWVSSMTGGTEKARKININLARMCAEFGFGMGLGSCRSMLYGTDRLEDFAMREYLGPDLPLFANLGIAQVENLVFNDETHRITDMIGTLDCDGLIVHVNPLQEWMQPEGDNLRYPALETIRALLDSFDGKVVVKEVGQGMGPESLEALLQLPLEAVELAAQGGTNFTQLEKLRRADLPADMGPGMTLVGHSALEMIGFINDIHQRLGTNMACRSIIISGGLRDYLDGFYLMNKLTLPSIYGHASQFLRYAADDYDGLRKFAQIQVDGLKMANNFLRVR